MHEHISRECSCFFVILRHIAAGAQGCFALRGLIHLLIVGVSPGAFLAVPDLPSVAVSLVLEVRVIHPLFVSVSDDSP